ncbi:hypothetical protein GCM10023085_52960 [Actinomadura viridis]|uniref:Uncharacterized protein n=1 Tax=Actinomadura viridis TaxID=58110 RepID=A0A931D8A5_9ACTN|nr:hypothetical protein [Actinomadura viridis]MBG6086264.1 hypothetical protein [Actinomadura viridis]
MSFELAVWYEPEPITAARAAATERGGIPPHPAVAAFARDAAEAFPDAEIEAEIEADADAGGSRHAVVRMPPDRADAISAEVYALARAHGLICHDPGRGLVHNLAPTPVHPETQLHTGDGMVVTDPDLGLVHDVLGRLSPAGNPFAALVLFGRHFIQVSPERGGYELEYKDSPRNVLYRTHVDDLGEVRRAFAEYARDERGFLDRLAWER